MMNNWRINTYLAESGESALAILQQNKSFRLIVIDAQMPNINGYTVAEYISKDPQLSSATVIMLSTTLPRIVHGMWRLCYCCFLFVCVACVVYLFHFRHQIWINGVFGETRYRIGAP